MPFPKGSKPYFKSILAKYPDLAEIEYRLTGLYFTLNQPGEGYIHLNNALHLDKEYDFIIEELFPRIYKRKSVFEIITNFKNS